MFLDYAVNLEVPPKALEESSFTSKFPYKLSTFTLLPSTYIKAAYFIF